MKNLILITALALLSACNNELKIDLPDEYPEISESSRRPDTLISWISGDTVHFRFLTAARNYPEFNH